MNVTLNIEGSIRVAIVSLWKNDRDVTDFINLFKNEIKDHNIIVSDVRLSKINDILDFFKELTKRNDYNIILIVTHGDENGDPTVEELSDNHNKISKAMQTWDFFNVGVLGKSCEDKLLLLAVCNSGNIDSIKSLTTGHAQVLHMVTSIPNENLPVVQGAKAMALFINELHTMNLPKCREEHLKSAKATVDITFPNIIHLWIYKEEY